MGGGRTPGVEVAAGRAPRPLPTSAAPRRPREPGRCRAREFPESAGKPQRSRTAREDVGHEKVTDGLTPTRARAGRLF